MIGFSPARVGAVAALSVAVSLVAVPLQPAHASVTPTISSVPSVVHNGSTLTVTGTGLEDTNSLKIGSVALTSLVAQPTQVTGTVPSTALSNTVFLTTSSGGAASSASPVSVVPVLTGLTGAVGDRAATLAWTRGGSGLAIARDVTGIATPHTTTSGRSIPVTGLTAKDATGFTNTVSRTYAVWAKNSDGTTSDAAPLVTVTPAVLASRLTAVSSYVTAPWGTKTLTLSGRLTRSVSGLPLASHRVDLWGGTIGKPAVFLRQLSTRSDGRFSTTLMPARSTDYSFRFAGDAFSQAANIPHVVVRVTARLSASLAPSTVLTGQSSSLRGQVLPRIPGVVLLVQRRIGTTWTTVGHVRTAADGTYRHTVQMPVGAHGFRAVLPAMPGLATAVSPQAVLRVDPRNLRDGMSGSDVLRLKQLLTGLRYDAGRLDSYYGYDLHHAVMTFQKVQRLPVTGYWGNAERLRATRPITWRVRYPSAGRAVEIDITKQVLVLSERGVVRRIIDVSTGNNERYTSQGVTSTARTPRGHFSITRKINGIRISHLGALYKPSYFVGGFAVHGSASVPNYAASHGCVRITNPNADRIFALLTVGTPVHLYDS